MKAREFFFVRFEHQIHTRTQTHSYSHALTLIHTNIKCVSKFHPFQTINQYDFNIWDIPIFICVYGNNSNDNSDVIIIITTTTTVIVVIIFIMCIFSWYTMFFSSLYLLVFSVSLFLYTCHHYITYYINFVPFIVLFFFQKKKERKWP